MFSKSSLVFALSVLAALSEVHVALAAPALSCIADTTSAAAITTSAALVNAVSTSAVKAVTTSAAKASSTSVAKGKSATTSVAKGKAATTTSVAKGKVTTTSAAKVTSTSIAKGKGVTTSAAKGVSTSVAKGTSVSTTSAASSTNVLSSTGSSGNATANNSNAQDSLTLDPKVIATGFEQDGQETPTAGQIASLTSNNNFINFCLTVPNLPITNGQQITTGSCNPAPMGVIAAQTNMPAAKFTSPQNFGTVPANTNFTITLAINNFQAGAFVNADSNFFAAPQTVNAQGNIIGHSHIVVEALPSLDSTTPLDNVKFTFFKGLNDPFSNGNQLSAVVPGGVPAGAYRIASINTAANHQPVLVSVAQHGTLDDMIYFTAVDGGEESSASTTTAAAAAAASTSAAAKGNSDSGNNNQKGKPQPAKGKNNQQQQQQQQKGNNDNVRGGRFF